MTRNVLWCLRSAAALLFNKLVHIPYKERVRHAYITGKTGSGKSEFIKILFRSYLLENRLKRRNSLVLIDPHGDLASEIVRLKEMYRHRKDLIYIDPLLDGSLSPIINPFDISPCHNVEKVAEEIGKVIASTVTDAALSVKMLSILIPCIAVLLRRGGGSFNELKRFMDDGVNHDLVELGKRSSNRIHAELFASAFSSSHYDQTKGAIYSRLQYLLNSSAFANITTGKSTVDIEKAINGRKIIIINLAKGHIGEQASEVIGKYIMSLLHIAALGRVNRHKRDRVPTYVFIDEFHNYITSTLETILTEDRKFGLHLTLATQLVGQNMGISTLNIVLANTNVKVMGVNNARSLAILAKETKMEVEQLENLKAGNFAIQWGERQAFVYRAPKKLLGMRHSMTDQEREEIKARQLSKYYKGQHIKTKPGPKFTFNHQ